MSTEQKHAERQVPQRVDGVYVDGQLVMGPAEHLVEGTAVPHTDEAPVPVAGNDEEGDDVPGAE
jgi:hypothetical protein